MRLITGGDLIRWCSLSGAPGAESVLHPVRLHRETINHQNGSKTEERRGRYKRWKKSREKWKGKKQ